MSDADNKNGETDLKEIEDSLFREFNEKLRLTEPTDVRLQSSVDLNPNLKLKSAAETEAEAAAEAAAKKAAEEASANQGKTKEEIELGQAFAKAVAKEEATSSEEALKKAQEAVIAAAAKPALPPIEKINIVAKVKQLREQNLKTNLKELLTFIKWFVGVAIIGIKIVLRWPWKYIFKYGFSTVFILAVGIGGYKYYKYREYMKNKSPYTDSFKEVADKTFKIADESVWDDFFSPLQGPEYIYLLPKVVANLKISSASSRNPMVLFEIIFRGSTQETAIEIKNRQSEMTDIVSRVVEGFTLDEVQTPEGKDKMKMAIQDELNLVLNNGQIVGSLYKTFILKP